MAGGFGDNDEARCQHYAAFASHLGRREFDFIYWFLFIGVIVMLFLSSWKYSGDYDKVKDCAPGSHEYRHKMKKCMLICSIYAAISVVAVVMEVYALMALQFCDGEDLMSLYWSTWAMMQVGSLIAIFGILLSVFNGLRGNKNPPWALALGTPVLVVAGIGHAFHGAMRKRVQKVRSRSRSRGMSVSSSVNGLRGRSVSDLPIPISREETIRVDDSEREDAEYRAKLVGYTPDGGPIIQFYDNPGSFRPERGSVIGKNEHGQVIVAFRKTMTTITFPTSDSSSQSLWREKQSSPYALSPSPSPLTSSPGLLAPPMQQQRSPSPTVPRPAVVRIATPNDPEPVSPNDSPV
ncbi:hypothetical protein B0H66DRAFT_47483 [Apodospora peruviana]|uniref:Uncharacterized protein n=1 Tax=Apodospora peruviana TaxID=516989 RepID=A0AAE0MF09_9PEZI|nr:hypothetical protein B0H66DRAFT_47483 [Apodospora peruviana]